MSRRKFHPYSPHSYRPPYPHVQTSHSQPPLPQGHPPYYPHPPFRQAFHPYPQHYPHPFRPYQPHSPYPHPFPSYPRPYLPYPQTYLPQSYLPTYPHHNYPHAPTPAVPTASTSCAAPTSVALPHAPTPTVPTASTSQIAPTSVALPHALTPTVPTASSSHVALTSVALHHAPTPTVPTAPPSTADRPTTVPQADTLAGPGQNGVWTKADAVKATQDLVKGGRVLPIVPGGPHLGEFTDEEGQRILEHADDMPFGRITFFSRYRSDPITLINLHKVADGQPDTVLVTNSDGGHVDDYVAKLVNGDESVQ